jgi:hypothetical protein
MEAWTTLEDFSKVVHDGGMVQTAKQQKEGGAW